MARKTKPDIEAMFEKAASVLERELERHDVKHAAATEADGKITVDVVSAISRTLEKVDAMRRLFKADREAADQIQRDGKTETIRRDELATQIAEKIDRLVEERAERLLAARRVETVCACMRQTA
jgi:hypothetical protein